jgi:hypothetical protein
MRSVRTSMVVVALLCSVLAFSTEALGLDFGFFPPLIHFVPNSQAFWDHSKNWTTNFGPAYRDTVERPENMVPCTGQYALCFHSGPEPLPCRLTFDGRFANCRCPIEEGLNFVLINAILNYPVYLDTIAVCGTDGSKCSVPDTAPVCQVIRDGRLIPGADFISTFSSEVRADIAALHDGSAAADVTICPKAPYAACMTAPCRATWTGDAECVSRVLGSVPADGA